MLTAFQILNTVANISVIIAAYNGYGRLDADPFLTPARKMTTMRYLYYSQVLCIMAMFVAKMSILAFLMVLNFSKSFRYVLWASVFVVVVCNLIVSCVNLFGFCWPIAVRWNPSVKGRCWPLSERLGTVYTQAIANIVIDLVYAASPLVYIRQIKLPTRTRWAVQIIFFLALL
jgi:hypothetical protein